jgi:two-component system, NarL family, response regulator NreC
VVASHLRLARAESHPAFDSASPIRIVLADNHAAMRRSLHLMLDGEDDIQVVAEAGDFAAVAQHLSHHRPQVLVLDLGMHNGSSIETIHRLRRHGAGPQIVVLTMEDSPAFARRALHAGAVGFVLKDRSDSELPEAVREAACGRNFVSATVAAGLDSRHDPATAGPSSAGSAPTT